MKSATSNVLTREMMEEWCEYLLSDEYQRKIDEHNAELYKRMNLFYEWHINQNQNRIPRGSGNSMWWHYRGLQRYKHNIDRLNIRLCTVGTYIPSGCGVEKYIEEYIKGGYDNERQSVS